MSKNDLLWSKELRQAVAAALDRETIISQVFGGHIKPAYHMIPPGYPFATKPFLDRYGTRNLDLSIKLLKKLGYTAERPFEFDLWYPSGDHYGTNTTSMMEFIRRQLEETGRMRVRLSTLAWGEFVHNLVGGKLPFFLLGWTPDFVDPTIGCRLSAP